MFQLSMEIFAVWVLSGSMPRSSGKSILVVLAFSFWRSMMDSEDEFCSAAIIVVRLGSRLAMRNSPKF